MLFRLRSVWEVHESFLYWVFQITEQTEHYIIYCGSESDWFADNVSCDPEVQVNRTNQKALSETDKNTGLNLCVKITLEETTHVSNITNY